MRIATVQFENKSGDKQFNLSRIEALTAQAAKAGARIVCFHELCVTGYTYLRLLDKEALQNVAEKVPDGESVQALIQIATRFDVAVLAGLVEEEDGQFFNTFIVVTSEGVVAKHQKLHPFISRYMSAGKQYTVFELFGSRCGILICYDNNVIENVRATALLGANILFAPHVTGCTPSPMPGRGYVDPDLWKNRKRDSQILRKEFDGRKAREWILRWLPARAYDNGIFVVYANPIGMDDDQLKPGGSMILDPFGDILAECRTLEDEVVTAVCDLDKIKESGGTRYRNARRPELYADILGKKHQSKTKPVWLEGKQLHRK